MSKVKNIGAMTPEELQAMLDEANKIQLTGVGRASTNLRDDNRKEHDTTREVTAKAIGHAAKKLKSHTTAEHEATRTRIGAEHSDTRSHIDRRTADIIRECGQHRMATWAIIVSIAVGILAAIGAGIICWPSVSNYLCWTLDSAGNRVQVANLAEATTYAKLLNCVLSGAIGILAGWAASAICDLFDR